MTRWPVLSWIFVATAVSNGLAKATSRKSPTCPTGKIMFFWQNSRSIFSNVAEWTR